MLLKIAYPIERYRKDTGRLYGVLDYRLADSKFIVGAYFIADMAAYPSTVAAPKTGQDLNDLPNLKRWFETHAPSSCLHWRSQR